MNPKFNASNNWQENRVEKMDSLQRDRFELLSAYLDGEVTAAERQQVRVWLDTDPSVQRQYRQLLKLRQSLQAMPVPAAGQQMADQVLTRLDRIRNQRMVFWGGTAIAALFLAAAAGLMPRFSSEFAKSKTAPEPLMIALNQPAVKIPKAPVSARRKFKATPFQVKSY
jgi:anti-sigma factor RsiW